jgi:hypothetical protein
MRIILYNLLKKVILYITKKENIYYTLETKHGRGYLCEYTKKQSHKMLHYIPKKEITILLYHNSAKLILKSKELLNTNINK